MIAPIPYARPGCSCPTCDRRRAMDRAARVRQWQFWIMGALDVAAVLGLLVGGWAGAGI